VRRGGALEGLADKENWQAAFQAKFNPAPAPSLDTQQFSLASGIKVRGILLWVQLLEMNL